MIEIRDGRFFARFFFMETPTFNMFGALYRDNGPWVLRYRVRQFRDAKVFDSEDERLWCTGHFLAPLSEGIAGFDAYIGHLRELAVSHGYAACPLEVIEVNSDRAVVVTEILNAQDWSHSRRGHEGYDA